MTRIDDSEIIYSICSEWKLNIPTMVYHFLPGLYRYIRFNVVLLKNDLFPIDQFQMILFDTGK